MIPRLVPVAAPARVATRLAGAADGPREVVHATATAVYVDLDGWALGLVSASATRVPCALWSTLPDLTSLAGRPALVRGGALAIGDHELRVARLADVSVPVPGLHEERVPGPPLPQTSGLDLPPDGRLTPEHLDDLLGRGPGLTPLGDDVLAGWFATRAALGEPDPRMCAAVRRRLGVTTLLSATLIDCALHGEALPQLAAWLADPSPAAAEALLAVGATSGAGLMAGARLALTSLTTSTPGRVA